MTNNPAILASIKQFLIEVGELTHFAARFFRDVFKRPFEFKEFLRQCYNVGNKSLLLVGVSGLIIGIVLTLQSRIPLVSFGAVSLVPRMVGIAIIREIGPIITALICAGRISSGIGAELGSMRVTEQIDAMEVSGTNPFKYLIVTRILATTLMLPLLVIFNDAIALFGSALVENAKGGVSFELFYDRMIAGLELVDVIPSTIKTFFFGFAIGLVGCYKGYHCTSGTEGVGKAANAAVVQTSMWLFIIDFIAVLVADIFFDL